MSKKCEFLFTSPLRYMESAIRFDRETYEWINIPSDMKAFARPDGSWFLSTRDDLGGIPVVWARRIGCVDTIKTRSIWMFVHHISESRSLIDSLYPIWLPGDEDIIPRTSFLGDVLDREFAGHTWLKTSLIDYAASCMSYWTADQCDGPAYANGFGGWCVGTGDGIPVDWAREFRTMRDVLYNAPHRYIDFMTEMLEQIQTDRLELLKLSS